MTSNFIQVELIYPDKGKVFRQRVKYAGEVEQVKYFYCPLMLFPEDSKERLLAGIEEVDEQEWEMGADLRRIIRESDERCRLGIRSVGSGE